jgi:hypothetical protein
MDTLSGAPVGPAGGNIALDSANQVAQPNSVQNNLPNISFGGRRNRDQLPPSPVPTPFDPLAVPGAFPTEPVAGAVAAIVKPKIRAIVGTRVFDAVTGVLLDDARVTYIEESEKENYYDDGTHGDLVQNDGEYAKVDVRRDVIGQSNQRIKERLIQALNAAEQLDPVDFYGHTLLTTDRTQQEPRTRRWKVVPDERGRIGYKLAEVDTDTPLVVPKLVTQEQQKDQTIAGEDGWAIRFLDEYRLAKSDVTSEFFPLYVPKPPTPPRVPPPVDAGWAPFPSPAGPGGPGAPAPAAAGGGAASLSFGGGSFGGR